MSGVQRRRLEIVLAARRYLSEIERNVSFYQSHYAYVKCMRRAQAAAAATAKVSTWLHIYHTGGGGGGA